MDILKNIVSILPTVGGIVGGLLQEIFKSENGLTDNKSVTYNLSLDKDPKNAQLVDFMVAETEKKGSEEIRLYNRCRFPLFLSTPAKNGYTGETQYVGVGQSVPVSQLFENMTKYDIDALQVSGASLDENDGGAAFQVASSGTLTVGDMGQSLGTYIFATVNTDTVSVEVNAGKLEEIISLRLRAADGTTAMEVSNIKNNELTGNIEIPLSVEQQEGQRVSLFVSLTVSEVPNGVAFFEQKNPYPVRNILPEEHQNLLKCDQARVMRKLQRCKKNE